LNSKRTVVKKKKGSARTGKKVKTRRESVAENTRAAVEGSLQKGGEGLILNLQYQKLFVCRRFDGGPKKKSRRVSTW